MANHYTRVLLNRIYFVILILFCTKCGPAFGKLATEKSSLALVIDNTGSMWDDIRAVKSGAKLIFKSVMDSGASRLENFILVTFNDPNITPALITTDSAEYISALNSIKVFGGGDCPEVAMKGIEEALLKSNPRSYTFVFTDASAKDYTDFTKIKSIAQKKSSQIVFALTGLCKSTFDPAYEVYHQLANATSGQVFHLEKGEVNKIVQYASEIVKAPRTVLAEKEFDPGYGKTIKYSTDEKTREVMIALSGTSPRLVVTGDNGTKAETSKLFETARTLVVKVNPAEPGIYTATLGSESKTKAIVTAATTFDFKHGFSILKPASMEDTVTRPIADKLLYLAIETDAPDNDVELKEVNILDTSDNILQVLPLNKRDKDFYLTEPVKAPNQIFRILVKGITKNTKKLLERRSRTSIEPQKLTDEGPAPPKAPTITSVGEPLKKVNYGDAFELRCKVNGFPKPRITWIEEKSGRTMSEMVEVVDLPYDYVCVLNIEEVKRNSSYLCRAFNDYGEDKKAVTVEAITKFDVVNISKDTNILYGEENSLNCLIDSKPPSDITWYINGTEVVDDDFIEISSNGSVLTILSMKPKLEGKYICEVKNEIKRQVYSMHVKMSDKALPKMDKTGTEINVKRNESVDINCKVTDGVPQPIILWFFKKQYSSDFVEIRQILDVHHIASADLDNAGTYRCEVFNDYGKIMKSIVLSVQYSPTIKDDKEYSLNIKQGTIVYLHCVVDGVPRPSVYWTLNGDIIENSATHHIFVNNTLRYRAADANGEKYVCKAVNKHGSAIKTFTVFIHVPPKIKIPEETTIKSVVGSNVTLHCETSGFPTPVVEWLFFNNGTKKVLRPTDVSYSVYLPRLQASQSGYYVCMAKNIGGSTNLTYTVGAIVPPTIKKLKNRKVITAVTGDMVLEVPCQAFGIPQPTIVWYVNDLKLSTGNDWYDMKADGTLIIKNVNKTSTGNYLCMATNEAGHAVDVIHVNVVESLTPAKPEKFVNLQLGERATVNCDIPHRPTDILRWYKDSKMIATGELTLNKVQISDQGMYTCCVITFSGFISATLLVTVGFKPEFLNDEKENREFFLGKKTSLSCSAQGSPTPKVLWKHNGKTLNDARMVISFTMLKASIGQYTCLVSNKFGTISRNFNVIKTGCLFETSSKIGTPTLTYYDVRSSSVPNIIQVPKGENVIFTCPGDFIGFPENNIEGTCIKDTFVAINKKSINASELKCDIKSISPVIKSLGLPCGPGYTQTLKVGYESSGIFVETYEICYDVSKTMPVYSTHRISPSLSGKEPHNASRWFENEFVPYNYDDLYDCESQIKNLSRYLRKPLNFFGNCCFARKQLVNPRDVSPGLPQMATYSNLNVVPQWSTCNSENWDEMEKRIESLSEEAGQELVIHTGIAEPRLTLRPIFITDKNNKRQRVPTFLWKVVQDESSKSSLAIIQLNVPNLNKQKATYYILCNDICQNIEWMINPQWQNVTKGFTYCCEVERFEKAFGFPKMFSPGMHNILYNVSVLPEHSLS